MTYTPPPAEYLTPADKARIRTLSGMHEKLLFDYLNTLIHHHRNRAVATFVRDKQIDTPPERNDYFG